MHTHTHTCIHPPYTPWIIYMCYGIRTPEWAYGGTCWMDKMKQRWKGRMSARRSGSLRKWTKIKTQRMNVRKKGAVCVVHRQTYTFHIRTQNTYACILAWQPEHMNWNAVRIKTEWMKPIVSHTHTFTIHLWMGVCEARKKHKHTNQKERKTSNNMHTIYKFYWDRIVNAVVFLCLCSFFHVVLFSIRHSFRDRFGLAWLGLCAIRSIRLQPIKHLRINVKSTAI